MLNSFLFFHVLHYDLTYELSLLRLLNKQSCNFIAKYSYIYNS